MSEFEFREGYRAYKIQLRRGRRLEVAITPPGWFQPLDEVLVVRDHESEDGLIDRAKIAVDRDLGGAASRR